MRFYAAVRQHRKLNRIVSHCSFVIVLVFVGLFVRANRRQGLRHEADTVACNFSVQYAAATPQKRRRAGQFATLDLKIKNLRLAVTPVIFNGCNPPARNIAQMSCRVRIGYAGTAKGPRAPKWP